MRMFKSPRPGYCASCEGAITGRPVYYRDEAYCCTGCVEGGPCICNYEVDLAEDGVDRLGLLVPAGEAVTSGSDRAAGLPGPSRRETAFAGRQR